MIPAATMGKDKRLTLSFPIHFLQMEKRAYLAKHPKCLLDLACLRVGVICSAGVSPASLRRSFDQQNRGRYARATTFVSSGKRI
jgi:hypothetical protein